MADISPPLQPARPAKVRKTGSRIRSVTALVLREMQARYGRSPGGYIWAILEPLGMVIIISYAFSLMLRSPALGNSFILYFTTGMMPFSMYAKVQQMTSGALMYSRQLLTYPVVNWVDAVMGRLILNVLTGTLVAFVIFTGILYAIGSRTELDYIPMISAYLMAICLGFGMGLVNCVIVGFFPVWQSFWLVITRPLFLASGVIILYEDMPPLAQKILIWNPLLHVTSKMREGFYPLYSPDWVSLTYVWSVGLIMIAVGLMLMRRFHQRFLKR